MKFYMIMPANLVAASFERSREGSYSAMRYAESTTLMISGQVLPR